MNEGQEISWEELAYFPEESVAQIERQLQFTVPAGENPLHDLEAILMGNVSEPEQECSVEQPSSLRAPSTEGKSPEFAAAVSAYVLEMCRAEPRWPKLENQQLVQLQFMLEAAAGDLASQPTGDVVVLNRLDDVRRVDLSRSRRIHIRNHRGHAHCGTEQRK